MMLAQTAGEFGGAVGLAVMLVVATFVALLPLYFCIRAAVGTALKEHQVWLEKRAVKLVSAEPTKGRGFEVVHPAQRAGGARKFRVSGIDRDTDKACAEYIDAISPEEAEQVAKAMGINVQNVQAV